MKPFSNLLCILCASSSLVACSYFDVDEARLETGKPGTQIDLMAGGDGMPVADVPDFTELVAKATDGRVQIFSLDDGSVVQGRAREAGSVEAAMPEITTLPDVSGGAGEVAQDLDMPVREVASVPTVRPDGLLAQADIMPDVFQGIASDPSVQIFSLDDGVPARAGYGLFPLPAASYNEPVSHGYVAAQEPVVSYAEAQGLPPAKPEDYVSLQGTVGDRVIIYFAHDSSALNNEDMHKIAGVVSRFNAAASQGLLVEGHASIQANYHNAAQRRIVNLKVSMDRAFAVSRALIEQGVPADAVRVMAWGDTKPPLSLDGRSAESAARRVEISG